MIRRYLAATIAACSCSAFASPQYNDLNLIAKAWAEGRMNLKSQVFEREFSVDCQPAGGYFSEDEQPLGCAFKSPEFTCAVWVVESTGAVLDDSYCLKN